MMIVKINGTVVLAESELDNGNSGNSINIDWTKNYFQRVTLNPDTFDSYAWSTSPSMPSTLYFTSGAGSHTECLAIGGNSSGGISNFTHKWSGGVWATTSAMTGIRQYISSVGDTSNALSIGGYTGATINRTEIWGGSSWATTSALNTQRSSAASAGSTAAAVVVAGCTGSNAGPLNTTETWDGSVWTANAATITKTLYQVFGCGNATNALALGGISNSVYSSTTYLWNGAAWSTTSNYLINGSWLVCTGDTSSARAFGGSSGSIQSLTGAWNGTAWSTGPYMNAPRVSHGGAGSGSAALAFGGSTQSAVYVGTAEVMQSMYTTTISFTDPTEIGNYKLKLIQDSAGGKKASWPANVKWYFSDESLSVPGDTIDFADFYFDGSYYYGKISKPSN